VSHSFCRQNRFLGTLASPKAMRVLQPLRDTAAQRMERRNAPPITLLLLLFCTLSATAQTATEIAARVDRHYNSLHSLSVNFTQEYNGLGQHLRESGVLLLKKPGRMKWTYSQPPGKLFVLDGHNAYFYSPGQTAVQRLPAKNLDDLRSPLRFLLGHAQLAKELTGLTLTPQGANFDLSGVPKNMEQRVTSLRFTVSSDGTILGIRVEEADGSVSIFTFTGEVPNPPSTDADFLFHVPAGTQIVDGLPPA
jgi:outer membrane lipoprotein carrier protein